VARLRPGQFDWPRQPLARDLAEVGAPSHRCPSTVLTRPTLSTGQVMSVRGPDRCHSTKGPGARTFRKPQRRPPQQQHPTGDHSRHPLARPRRQGGGDVARRKPAARPIVAARADLVERTSPTEPGTPARAVDGKTRSPPSHARASRRVPQEPAPWQPMIGPIRPGPDDHARPWNPPARRMGGLRVDRSIPRGRPQHRIALRLRPRAASTEQQRRHQPRPRR